MSDITIAMWWIAAVVIMASGIRLILKMSSTTYHINTMSPVNPKDWYTGDWIAECMIREEPMFFGDARHHYFRARGRGTVWRDATTGRRFNTSFESMLADRWTFERWQKSDDEYRSRH